MPGVRERPRPKNRISETKKSKEKKVIYREPSVVWEELHEEDLAEENMLERER